ncbi:glycoside hydrolase family 6 protein [Streptomyces sp. NPDC046716]|uniref:glycoside hydrolase family 6 protein n=1 Tax=Streptomyces sp. NPDC046716 TaxID=3157093 RepID=UPI0033D99DB8
MHRNPLRGHRPHRRRLTRPSGAAALTATALAAALLTPWSATAGTARAAEHVDNPFQGADAYVNPDYTSRVEQSADKEDDADLAARMRSVGGQSTAVWLDRIAAIEGGAANDGRLGLTGHLDKALAQKQPGTPMTATFVVYDLPGRDCSALASNGELPLTEAGLERYEKEYIDPIADALADPKYADLRITTVIEPDGLPNLVTNLSDPECAQAKASGLQVKAVQYALDKLHALPNVYTYLDAAHSGWLGWDDNLKGVVDLYTETARGTKAGLDSVDGVVTNVSNYTPTTEPHLDDPDLTVGGQALKSAKFYEWNPNFDEADYADALRTSFAAAGWSDGLGVLVDTSRNGWGGADRPGGASGDTADAYVTSGRVDRRTDRGNWCNQQGAGLGARPQGAPADAPGVDAYLWVKPPGESDGSGEDIDNGEGKRPDPNCDPDFTTPKGVKTGALPDAPLAGHWFDAQFAMLVKNAYPAVSTAPSTKATQASYSTKTAAADGDDWLHTDGAQVVDEQGDPVWMTGTNWFGFNTTERVFHGLWSANLETITRQMAERGLNTIRVPLSTQLVLEWQAGRAAVSSAVNTYENPDLKDKTTLEVFDRFLELCKTYGIKVMLDVHSAEADNSGHMYPVWWKGAITSEDFYRAWEWLADRYKNDDTVIAADVKNEPHGKQTESPRAKWDDSTDEDNWKNACQTAGRRILAINPHLLVLCEGIEIYPRDGENWQSTNEADYHFNWWGGNLRGAADHPVDLGKDQDQLVYSPHDYGPAVFRQPWFEGDWNKDTLTEDVWQPNWYYLQDRGTAPLLIGEWGGRLDGADNQKWMTALRDFITEHRINQTFWCLNPNSGDTGGLLKDDWKTWDEEKYAFLEPALWQSDGRFVGLDHAVPIGGVGSRTGLTPRQVSGRSD